MSHDSKFAMRRILHVVCDPAHPLKEQFIREQRAHPELEVRVFEFRDEPPDYRRLLQEIFEADSVEVW